MDMERYFFFTGLVVKATGPIYATLNGFSMLLPIM
jgi:hypothetical protein